MTTIRRWAVMTVAIALAVIGLTGAREGWAAGDPGVAHVDGYLTWVGGGERGCMRLRQHDGAVLGLSGGIVGLRTGDHVRLEGSFVQGERCGAQGFQVSVVQTLWGDDQHRTTLYDHLVDGSFERFARRTGRIAQSELGRPEPFGPAASPGERAQRTALEGTVSDTHTRCPVLRTAGGSTYNLSGSVGPYEDGDWVRIAGLLTQQDPAAPGARCGGGWMLRVDEIRGR